VRNFYIALSVLSGGYLAAQTVAYVFFGKVFFPDAGTLFEKKRNKMEWQTVFPHNMLRLIIFIFVSAVTGLLLDLTGMAGWISMPMAAMGGLLFNFLLNMVFSPLYFKAENSGAPTDKELEGMDAVVTERIIPESYGTVRVRHGKRSYTLDAVSANGRILPYNTKVIIIYSEDGLCFVESEERFFDVLFEDDNSAEENEEETEENK